MVKRAGIVLAVMIGVFGIFVLWLFIAEPEYAYIPGEEKLANMQDVGKIRTANLDEQYLYDLWGQKWTEGEAAKTGGNPEMLSPANGAVKIDGALLELGRESMYAETFGNEVFLTDVMGIVGGPLRVSNLVKAIIKLNGQGTTNLKVELAEDVTVGGVTYKKGDLIDTGLDVPKGAYAPIGVPVKFAGGKVKAGLSCMACHAAVDPKTGLVVEGAPNADFNVGLLLALATNSAAFFTHTDIHDLSIFAKESQRSVEASDGTVRRLPDIESLEKAVDDNFAKWPKGYVDSTIDMASNPTQIPDAFTNGGFPYGWSGHAMAGPFNGLSSFNSNVHAQNTDSLAQSHISREILDIDEEVYIGTILQNAANPAFRYRPESGMKPSEFFASVDPTPGVPGVNEMFKPPSFPRVTLMAPDGLLAGSPGTKAAEQINAMSAFENTLVPPDEHVPEESVMMTGQKVFQRAGCIRCHAGEAFTNHRIVPSDVIGTEPSRAKAFKSTKKFLGEPSLYAADTPIPIPPDARVLPVPYGHLDPEQIALAYGWGDSPGGYKVKGLIGLKWSAPYLHDGGVAVGSKLNQLGVPGTLGSGVLPDPYNSLKAMVDRELRKKVVEANRGSEALKEVHITGEGHGFWVDDQAGFTQEEQHALIEYLLHLHLWDGEKQTSNRYNGNGDKKGGNQPP